MPDLYTQPWTPGARFGDAPHDEAVRALMEVMDFYTQQLTPAFQKMVGYWGAYFGDREDKRLPHERWRAHTSVPYSYSGTETAVAVLSDIFNSADPPIQAVGVGSEDFAKSRRMERVLDYTCVKNRWSFSQSMHFREMKIQGSALWKIVHTRKSHIVRMHPTLDDIKAYQQTIENAVLRGAGDPPEDPEEFEVWRETVNAARRFGQIGEFPQAGPKEIIEYRGPWYERTSLFDTRFDPMVEDMDNQHFFFHRIVKPESWLMERTGNRPWHPFDPGQVAEALRQTPEGRFSEYDEQISDMLKIPRGESDPTYTKSVELFECWSREPGFPPYAIVLNRKAIINKRADQNPYFHGKWPFVLTRNVAVPRRALGISDFQPTWDLIHQINIFRDLRLDALLLAVLPVYWKLKEMGLPALQQHIFPGMMVDLPRADGIGLLQKPTIPAEIWREEEALKNDYDETNATPPHVRGSQATIGRISATEQQNRLNQSLLRQKNSVLGIEDEWQAIPRQSVALWYQFSDEKLRLKIGGEDGGPDPWVEMQRTDLLEAMDMDFRFRGASKALNRELHAQQLSTNLETAHRLGLLLPEEGRTWLTRILETLGHKGVTTLITEEGTKKIVAAAQQAAQAAAQQAQLNKLPVPSEVPVPEGGQGEAPPA